jgi:DNA-binding GntR family transcriptional regulator
MLETIRPQYKTITQLVVENLRERIVIGEIKPGERIFQEVLAKEYNVSKIPIREALQLLNGEGYICIEANKGATASIINPEQIDELFSMKMLLETDLLADSLLNISNEKLSEAREIVAKLDMVTSASNCSELTKQYYNCLYSGIKRPETQKILNLLRVKTERCSRMLYQKTQYQEHRNIAVKKLLEYCCARQVDMAVSQLKYHLTDTKNEIKRLLQ